MGALLLLSAAIVALNELRPAVRSHEHATENVFAGDEDVLAVAG